VTIFINPFLPRYSYRSILFLVLAGKIAVLFSFAKAMEMPVLLRSNHSGENIAAQQQWIFQLVLRSRIHE